MDLEYKVDVTELFEEYSEMVYKVAFIQMKNQSDTDDIFGEVFFRLVKHANTLQSKEHAKAWLYRVTINCCKQYYRSSWYKKVIFIEESTISEDIFRQHESVLHDTLVKLPYQYRIVIHMFYYEQYSVNEIAELLGSKENTVKSNLFRARKLLKEDLIL